MPRWLTLSGAALATMVAVPGGLDAQAPPPSAPPRFEAGVAVVALPVFVTDKDHRPVNGLAAADFEVLDDGKPVPIVGFQAIDAAETVPGGADASASVQAAARRQFLFLFDLSFSTPPGIVRARKAALQLAETGLLPRDLAGVATFSIHSGVRLLLGLTTDRQQLSRAVDTLGVLHVERAPDPLALTYELFPDGARPIETGADTSEKEAAIAEHLRDQVVMLRGREDQQYAQRVGSYLSGLQQLARALDAVRGRKQVVLLSAGFDQTPLMGAQGEQAAQDAAAVTEGRLWEVRSESRFGDSRVRQAMDEMVKAFSASDAVVHAVDVSGLFARGDAQDPAAGARPGAGRESLRQIADLTGGRLIKDTNDIAGALREVIDGTRRGYVLAFEPLAKAAGRFHRLKVRVKGRGFEVSHRGGYVEPAPTRTADAQARRLQAAEVIAKGISGGDFEVRLLAMPYRDAEGRLSLPVVLEVDGAGLVPSGASGELPLELYGYALDERESIVDLVALSPTLNLAKLGARVRESGLQLQTAFAVQPGRYDLRFVVRDTSSGRMGSRRLEVEVPAFTGAAVVISPPFFMADPAQRLVLKAPSRRHPGPDLPFRVAADLFTPQGRPRLVNGRADAVCVMAFSPTPFDSKSSFQISAHLTDPAGGRVPLGAPMSLARVVGETDGFRRFVLNVTPTGVPAGDYTFRVRLKDPLSDLSAESAQTVRVE